MDQMHIYRLTRTVLGTPSPTPPARDSSPQPPLPTASSKQPFSATKAVRRRWTPFPCALARRDPSQAVRVRWRKRHARACVRACARACVRACVRAYVGGTGEGSIRAGCQVRSEFAATRPRTKHTRGVATTYASMSRFRPSSPSSRRIGGRRGGLIPRSRAGWSRLVT